MKLFPWSVLLASNSFGEIFRITTFGESHGSHIGVVIDGCPSGVEIDVEEINRDLALRSPGKSPFTSPRNEEDRAEILSGIFEGKTTGAPIAILIQNKDANSSSYEEIKNLYRPGHANYTYIKKYGTFDYRGGGRASARETAARVAAGAVAKIFLRAFDIECVAFINEIGGIGIESTPESILKIREKTYASPIFCPCNDKAIQMQTKINEVMQEGDSIGGVVQGLAVVPGALGDPVYRKIEALLAFGMLSIPASKGFEIGEGFNSSSMLGSSHNDAFENANGKIQLKSNSSGGTLGGITTGEILTFRVAFKPTSSIKKVQQTVTLNGDKAQMTLCKKARHDPCVAIRAVPVVEAMTALVLADAFLLDQVGRRNNSF